MPYKAIEAVEKAFDDTKKLLLPFDLRTWSKLALIAVLAGGAGGFSFPSVPSGSPNYSPETGQSGTSDFSGLQSDLGSQASINMATGAFSSTSTKAAVTGAVGLIASLILLVLFINSVFQFIYYQSLIEKNVRIIKNFRNNTGLGFRLFLFRFVWLAVLISIAGIGVAAVIFQPVLILGLVLLALPLILIIGVINLFVNTFVVLRMLESGERFITSAKSVYTDVRSEWKEFVLFIFINILLGMAVSTVIVIGALITLIALAMPVGVVGILFYMVNPILIAPVAVIGVLIAILMVLVGLVAPTSTFMYYYSIEVYHLLTSEN
ncbi:MAG: hypothetical protein BRC29_02415 [Nanohaloarchaea archaeon SW_7_43_1]|nr:MAG: hypothetical protein BRC29_02415 [Nanohaloarchaea archaeon SW_7_43_1]